MLNNIDVCIPTMNRVDLLFLLANSIPRSWNIHVADNGGYLKRSGRCEEKSWNTVSSDDVIDLYPNWRKATTLGEASWFFLPSDDDLYDSTVAELEVNSALAMNPDVGMIIFGHNIIDENGTILKTWIPPLSGIVSSECAFNLFKSSVHARMPSILFNRESFFKSGGISDRYSLTAGDSEVIQRLCIRDRVMFVPKVIASYRVWNGSFTHQKIASKTWSDEIEIWMEMLDQELAGTSWGKSKLYRKRIQDEIRLQNINQGLHRLHSLKEQIAFLKLKPYPLFASIRTQVRFAKEFFQGRSQL